MDWTKYGLVIASKYRTNVLLSLMDSNKTPKQIANENKYYLSHVSNTLKELEKIGAIECLTPELRKGKIFKITSIGKDIISEIKTHKSD
ncbi:MAG: hypothetical protein ACE5KT_04425 [Methanosarcinales archaeon]